MNYITEVITERLFQMVFIFISSLKINTRAQTVMYPGGYATLS